SDYFHVFHVDLKAADSAPEPLGLTEDLVVVNVIVPAAHEGRITAVLGVVKHGGPQLDDQAKLTLRPAFGTGHPIAVLANDRFVHLYLFLRHVCVPGNWAGRCTAAIDTRGIRHCTHTLRCRPNWDH